MGTLTLELKTETKRFSDEQKADVREQVTKAVKHICGVHDVPFRQDEADDVSEFVIAIMAGLTLGEAACLQIVLGTMLVTHDQRAAKGSDDYDA